MSDNELQSNASDHPEQQKPQPGDNQVQRNQESKTSPDGRRAAPARRPLFRN